jgi:KDO2-lipid IV(A) lauroyltransferase
MASLRHRLEYGLFRMVIGSLRLLPLAASRRIAAASFARLGPRRRQHRRALANLRVAFPEKSEAEREAIARAMWANMGRVLAETIFIDRIVETPGTFEMPDRDVLERYRGKLGSIVAVSLHMGNWELAIWPLAAGGQHPAAVYRAFANPLINDHLMRQRRRLYPGGLFGKGKIEGDGEAGRDTARRIIDYARKGGRLGFVCDHVDRGGISVPFLGRTARFTPIPAMIARRVGARMWIGRCVRLGEASRFRLEVRELKVPRSANMGADVRSITAAMVAQFEAWIREHPEQWMWWNTRFDDVAATPVESAAGGVEARPTVAGRGLAGRDATGSAIENTVAARAP